MKNLMTCLGMASLFFFTGCASKPSTTSHQTEKKTVYNDQNTLRRYIQDWPVSSRYAAEDMIEKYGMPRSVTKDFIVWVNTGYFKRSTVYKNGVTHNFPTPHEDVLEQSIGYRIPARAVDELWRFDGSIMVDRTRGELISRCQREEMNILAFNLADNIIQNRMTVSEARKEHDSSAHAFIRGESTSGLMAGLNFSEYLNAGDPDHGLRERNLETMQAQEARPEDEKLIRKSKQQNGR